MNVLKRGEGVKIVRTEELKSWRLGVLAGRTGVVEEVCCSEKRRNKGYMIRLTDGVFEGESLWFIPQNAVIRDES